MNTRKILFTDLDGTLLNDDALISEYTLDVLRKMTSQGHILVLSSGRSLPNVIKVRDDLGLTMPGVYIASTNGALIYECDSSKIIYESRITLDDVKNVWPMAKERGIHIQTYTETELVLEEDDEESKFYKIKCPLPLFITNKPWEDLKENPTKMLVIDLYNKKKLEAFGKEVSDKYSHLTTVFSNDRYLEIFSCNAGKGNALRWLCNYLNIPVSNSYAAGDAGNDISMLEAAGTGVAMCNGDPEIFEYASEITQFSNNDDGLAKFIEKDIILH